MKTNFAFISLLCLAMTLSCTKDVLPVGPVVDNGVSISLSPSEYRSGNSVPELKSDSDSFSSYDFVDVLVADKNGDAVTDIKTVYYPETSEIQIEGLREGDYRLMILAVKGDMESDGATVQRPTAVSDVWISFPEEISRPLSAEYFYSSTDFQVARVQGENGYVNEILVPSSIRQNRIVSRIDVSLTYNNDDIRTATKAKQITFEPFRCASDFAADGTFHGGSLATIDVLDIDNASSFVFMPTTDDSGVGGTVRVVTEDYEGTYIENEYVFSSGSTEANRINGVAVDVVHPNDNLGTRHITQVAYDEVEHPKILQDDEHKTVYTDRTVRSFNTSMPLQISFTDEGKLNARFYSPKPLKDVLIRARIPAEGDEFFDVAYFDSIPAFADYYGDLNLTVRKGMYKSESGKIRELGTYSPSELEGIEFKIVSDDPYWQKILQIKHGWNLYFGLYGGDPDLPDGGPVGNWMGIRPVHCREAVAFFINFTYMIDMKEHEDILRENEDILYGNGGVNDKVTADRVLSQMRQNRTLQIGLVYPGNGVIGLGGGSSFGAYQHAWLTHYTNTYACEIMFHELGHVMGYNHSSAFTYGPWAQQLMNRFYVNNLHLMPVESSKYLDSRNNPNLYQQ